MSSKNINPAQVVEVEKGRTYYWCACGNSSKQPFCDGSHQQGDLKPVKFTATKHQYIYFCGCKKTNKPPFCDGSHIPR